MPVALLALAAGAGLYHHVKDTPARRLLRLPATPIADVKEDSVVRVHGTIAATQPLTAPLTGRKCVAFEVTARVRHELADDFDQGELRTVLSESVEFTVADLTGDVMVPNAEFRFTQEPHHAKDSHLVERGNREEIISVEEYALLLGSTVSVCGQGRWVSSPEGSTYRTTGRVLQMVAPLVVG